MYNILIYDDERDIINALKIYLSNPNYTFFVTIQSPPQKHKAYPRQRTKQP